MTPLVQAVTQVLSIGTIIADILIAIILIALFLAWAGNKSVKKLFQTLSPHILWISFLISLGAPLGSLFYSQVAGFEPCELCWWQRIFAYPAVIVLAWGLWYSAKHKKNKADYTHAFLLNLVFNITLTLSIIGAAIAAYHSYGQLLNPDALPSCAATGVSCAKLYFLEYGYVAIPTMSLTAFLLLISVILIYKVGKKT